jgi:hypothetical protein
MNDVLPKPFTKDSLLGMLEKHLLRTKSQQQMDYLLPNPVDSREVEIPSITARGATPEDQTTEVQSVDSHFDPVGQFPFDGDYHAIFGPARPDTTAQMFAGTSVAKRNEQETHEFLDPGMIHRSSGEQGTKRAKYSTHQW